MVMSAIAVNLQKQESKDESNQWLSDTKTVAIAYREQLTNEAMDCVALQDDDALRFPMCLIGQTLLKLRMKTSKQFMD